MRDIDVPWGISNKMDEYLQVTRLVDLDASTVRDTAARLVQGAATPREAAISIYNFCRDEIKFGYNRCDAIPASEVLRDGYGQCNTKSVLLVALLRAANIPARFHLAQVDKAVQLDRLGRRDYGQAVFFGGAAVAPGKRPVNGLCHRPAAGGIGRLR